MRNRCSERGVARTIEVEVLDEQSERLSEKGRAYRQGGEHRCFEVETHRSRTIKVQASTDLGFFSGFNLAIPFNISKSLNSRTTTEIEKLSQNIRPD